MSAKACNASSAAKKLCAASAKTLTEELTTAAKDATTALDTCKKAHTGTTTADKATEVKDCKAKQDVSDAAAKALAADKCGAASSGGLVIIIIIVVAVLCIAGCAAYYFCHHKKKQAAEEGADAVAMDAGMGFNDDLYMAFIDRESA